MSDRTPEPGADQAFSPLVLTDDMECPDTSRWEIPGDDAALYDAALKTRSNMTSRQRTIGWLIAPGAITWMVVLLSLAYKLHWPESYGIDRCYGKGCYFYLVYRSPTLLSRHPNMYSVALFVALWVPPVLIAWIAYETWKYRVRGRRYSEAQDV